VQQAPMQPRKRHNEIVDTAARIFCEKGFAAATMQDIADDVGILKSSLYHYFTAKDALLEEIVAGAHAQGRLCVAEATGADDPLSAFVVSYLQWASGSPHEAALLLERQTGLSDDTRDRVEAVRRWYRRFVARSIASTRRDVDSGLAAEAVLGFLTAASRSNALSRRKADGLGAILGLGLAA
jgi:AcrR family transcriptional regulator